MINIKDGKVYIKREAFRNMITHVLRFGNDALDESVEVMGICIGKLNDKDIDLINAIPITHGKEVSLGLTSEDYNTFTQIENKYASHNMNIVGWYSSHPGWSLFFSDSAIKNHHFFQNVNKPYGFYIVFDHTLMGKEGKLGFEIFRLNDYSDEKNTEYHKVVYELELPNTLEYFKWVQKFVEDTQKKAPILIKEINELTEPTPSELQEIPAPEETLLEVEPIISGFQEGASKFADIFMDNFKSQLGNWTKDIKEGSLIGSKLIRNATSIMKNKISNGMSKVETWFKRNLDEISNNFKENIAKYVDPRIDAQKDLKTQFSISKDEISNDLINLVEINSNNILNKIENNIKGITEEINNTNNITFKLEEKINNTIEKISTISNELENFSNEIENIVSADLSSLEQNFANDIEKLNTELNSINELYLQMSKASQKLQKIINYITK
ncbi:MAG: hypothetical protein ACFE8A_09805 [Candidatus Hodarchaeota archaeon]